MTDKSPKQQTKKPHEEVKKGENKLTESAKEENKAVIMQEGDHKPATNGTDQASGQSSNPAMNAIESEAKEILGHLSNDYDSARLDESFTLPSGLTPKGKGGVFWERESESSPVAKHTGRTPTSNGGMLFWTGDAGGPRDFSVSDPYSSTQRPSDLPAFRRKSAIVENPDEGDENSEISYVLDRDEPTFFCGLERF
jgi:hypothetical protein